MRTQIKENVYFAYHRDFEYIATLAGMLADNLDGRICREIYDEAFILKIRRKHRELTEFLNSLSLGGFELIEFYMEYRGEKFELEAFRQHVARIDNAQFIYQFFGYQGSIEEISKALEDEEMLARLMDEGALKISSFINLKRLINHRNEFLDLYFSALEDIRTPELEAYLDEQVKKLPVLQNEVEERLQTKNPFDVILDLAGKYCDQTQDYEYYGFIPVFMLPRTSVIYYAKDRFILYSKRKRVSREKAMAIIKAIADDTRIRVIDLLSETGGMNGKKIASWMHLAPSTVSHHMEQLVECGIVKEEKSGNSKVYSINHESGENFVREVEAIILKNTDHR